MQLDRILLIDKPAGWTSFDVVAKLRGAMQAEYRRQTGERRKIKVGHTGTLDPMATGLLVVLTSKNTKKVPEMIKQDKVYEVEMTLGASSDSGDAEGLISPFAGADARLRVLGQDKLKAAILSFQGEIMQTPPAFSAIKVNGKRAYQLAREGKRVELKPRPVTVYEIKDIFYSNPKVRFTTKVSSGTYIRSLVEDIGQKLGTGAYMSGLRRTQIGDFSLEEAVMPDEAIENLA